METPQEITSIRKYTTSQGIRLFHLLREGASDDDIAAELGVTANIVSQWIEQYRLAVYRQPPSEANAAAIRARAAETVEAWRQKVSAESAALSADGFGLVREKLNERDARGFNDAARAVNTLVQMTRQAEGLGSEMGGSGPGSNGLSVLVLRVGEGGVKDLRKVERNVTPAEAPAPEDVAFDA